MKVLILVAIPHFDYADKKSAVLSWMNQIKAAFEEVGDEVLFADTFEGKISKSVSENKSENLVIQIAKSILKLWPWLYYSFVFKKYFKALDQMEKRILQKYDCDLVVEFHTVGSTIGKSIAEKCQAQFSVIFDSPVEEQFLEMHGTKSIYWKRICESERITMEAANKIMVYSQACEDHIRSKYSIQARVNHLPSSLNKATEKIVRKETETFNIGFIGSFLSWHKLDMLVRVFEKFNAKYPKSRLILLGYGQEWKRIRKQIEASEISDKCDLPGFVDENELIAYKRVFTIAVMPGSNWYGSPLKLFEYSRAGIPFVAPVSKTVSSIYKENEHCLYVKAADEEGSLFEALEKYYLDPALRNELGKNAQTMIEEKFNKKAYYKMLIQNLS